MLYSALLIPLSVNADEDEASPDPHTTIPYYICVHIPRYPATYMCPHTTISYYICVLTLGVNAQEEEDSPAPDPRRSSRRDKRERGVARGREAKLISGRGGGRSAADAITLSDTDDSEVEEGGDRKEGGLSRSGGWGGLDLGTDAITVSDSEDSKEEEGGGGA